MKPATPMRPKKDDVDDIPRVAEVVAEGAGHALVADELVSEVHDVAERVKVREHLGDRPGEIDVFALALLAAATLLAEPAASGRRVRALAALWVGQAKVLGGPHVGEEHLLVVGGDDRAALRELEDERRDAEEVEVAVVRV